MRTALIVLAALAFALPLRAQQLPVKGYGQELVDQVMAKERGLLVVVMHVSPPGAANYPIIASNIGRIGKVADEDDMRVVTTGKTNLEVAHGGTRFEVEMPMQDLAGNTIGRSEEHTSELQSRPHLVCRLLLEKKKNYHRSQTRSPDLHLSITP